MKSNYNSAEKSKGSKFARGTLILLIGGIICKFIGAFYRIPLSNILGAEGMGVYQLIFPIYSLFLILASGGIPVALSKLTAECRARGEKKRAKRFLLQGIISLIIISAIFSVVFIIFAEEISNIQGNSQAYLGYFAVSVAIIFASVLTAFRGYFQGYQNMTPTAVSQIVEQVFKLILGLGFAYYLVQYGITYGVFGAMLGIAIGELVSLVYLLISYFYHRKKTYILEPEITTKFWSDYRLLLKNSFPITLNVMILPLLLAVDSFLIVNLLMRTGLDTTTSTQMFGVYSGMVSSLINLPSIVSLSLAISIIPAFSFNKEKGEDNKKLISSSFKVILFITIPTILIYIAFSLEIMSVLYPNVANAGLTQMGSSLLQITAINIFYISFLQISTAILQANNKSFVSVINLAFAGIIKVILTVFLVLSPLNIYGAAIASVLCFGLATGLNVIALKNEFGLNIKAKQIGYIFMSSGIVLGMSLGLKYLFRIFLSNFISVFLAIFVAAVIYLILVIFLPIFEDEELGKIPFGEKILAIKEKIFSKFKTKKL